MNIKWKVVKQRAKIIGITLLGAFLIYGAGTFYPNPYTLTKLEDKIERKYAAWASDLGLHEPAFEYTNEKEFVDALTSCVDFINFQTPPSDRVPIHMVIGQAALESGWGESRFAREGNNLFGIRTYNKKDQYMLPEGVKKWPGWGVKVFTSKCDGVRYYVELLNNHSAYEKFRTMRNTMILTGNDLDSMKLIKTLDKYSTTPDYADRVISIIKKLRTM